MKYQAYAEYKESGVEFIGLTPVSWMVTKFKYAIKFQEGPGILAKDFFDSGVPLLRIQNVKEEFVSDDYKTFLNEFTVEQKWKQFKVCLGDIIMSCSASTGIVSEVDLRTVGAIPYTGLIRLWPILKCMDKDFIKYFVQSDVYSKQIEVLQTGATIQHYGPIHLNQISISMPEEEEEQQKIAAFLYYETAKIDTLIEKQQQLIKLLKEKRQAVISHAVTKGLDPQAKMKDSGVEWLGEVPVGWRVKRAKYLFDFITSGSRGWADYYSDAGDLFFRIANLTRDTIEPKLESLQYVDLPPGCEGVRARIQLGDLLISITADLGSVCMADERVVGGYVSQHVSLCRPGSSVINSRWLAYFILSDSAKEQFFGAGYGGTKIQLSLEDIRELWLVQPSALEQNQIANFIDKELLRFAKLMNLVEDQVSILVERRTALISAAVTGKIDVRNFTPPASIAPALEVMCD